MDFLDFFEPIRIGANINLLRRATILETYTIQQNNEIGRVCSICQNNYGNGDIVRKINHCSHFYHHICLDQWLENNTKCPECQYDLRESQPTTQPNQNTEQPIQSPSPSFTHRFTNPSGLPPSFNHPFNNPLLQQRNPYIQIALQERINEIIRNRLENNTSNVFAIPIFRHERERERELESETNENQNILNEINDLRSILMNSLNQTLNGRMINSIINQNVSRTQQSNNTLPQNATQNAPQNIPQNIQQIIQAITNSISSDNDTPTVEVEYYYQNDNSPSIQRITQQIQRPQVTVNEESSNRPPPSLDIDSEIENKSDTESESDLISTKEDEKKNKKYKKIIKTEYILDDSVQDNNEEINNTRTSLELIVSKINDLEKKIEDLKIIEMEIENNNIKKKKCSLFSCWKNRK